MKKKKRTAHRSEPTDGRGMGHLLLSALKGAIFAACFGGILLLIVTAAALSGDDPTPLVRPMGYGISALIAFGAGLLTVRLHGRRVLPVRGCPCISDLYRTVLSSGHVRAVILVGRAFGGTSRCYGGALDSGGLSWPQTELMREERALRRFFP